jgi:hypothetical protein
VTTTYVLTGLLVAVCVLLGSAKLLALAPMRERAAHIGFSVDQYRVLGALELAAAAGLLIGLAAPALGTLAACGLLLLLGGAFAIHLRAGDGAAGLAPSLVVGAVTAGYLISLVASHS